MDKHPRGKIECWLDRHNHKMELVRTIIPVIVLVLQFLMFYHFWNGGTQPEKVVIREVPVHANCWNCHYKK